MPGWDWTFVGELSFGIGVGIAAGGWAFAHALEMVAMRVVTNPSVRKLANAADKFQGGIGGGGWAGVVGGIVNWLSGGRAQIGAPQQGRFGRQKALVVDQDGRVLGEADVEG